MRFDKEIQALLRAIPISQCKYSLKIATSRSAFISMSLLKEKLWRYRHESGRDLNNTFTHTYKNNPLPLNLKDISFCLLYITHQKNVIRSWRLVSFQMLWTSMAHKGKENRAPRQLQCYSHEIYIEVWVYDKPTRVCRWKNRRWRHRFDLE